MGSIGNDQYGTQLKEGFRKDGINDCLYTHKKLQTGVCAVLLNKENRCLIPNLGAACAYPDSHIDDRWVFITYKSLAYGESS